MTLTLLQRKLLKLLAINCRYTNKDLAQALGVSADAVQYQIDKLVQEQYISFEFHIDCRLFGYDYYQFYVALNDPAMDVTALCELPFVTFVGKIVSVYEYEGTFIARGEQELSERLAAVRAVFGSALRTFHVDKLIHEYKWTYIIEPFDVPVQLPKNRKNLLYGRSQTNLASEHPPVVKLDSTDYSILGALATSPRIHYVGIAQQLGISHETVRNRLRNMVERGLLMNFTTFCNFHKFGYFSHGLLLRLQEFDRGAFAKFVQERVYLQLAIESVGDHNMLIYTSEKNPEEFAAHVAEIKQFFGEGLLEMQLFYFEKQLKNLQFPTALVHTNSLVTTHL